jgi:hypothetical protein
VRPHWPAQRSAPKGDKSKAVKTLRDVVICSRDAGGGWQITVGIILSLGSGVVHAAYLLVGRELGGVGGKFECANWSVSLDRARYLAPARGVTATA